MQNKLFLIDGHALIFKTYFAFYTRPMINSKGVDTSIIYGFTKYILDLIEKENPSHFAVVFDPPGGTFRNKLYPEYKANRQETPQPVIDSLNPLINICKAMQIPAIMVMNYEADDVIGTIAKLGAEKDFDVYMVSPDKDYGQLVQNHIWQYKPGKSGAENEILGEKEICEKFGINKTSQVIDLLALWGDSADNVPGVNGVGSKTAAKLLDKYDSLENIYKHLDELSAKQKEKFIEAQPYISLSKELVTIKTDVKFDCNFANMKLSGQTTPELIQLFDLYEFNSLRKYLKNAPELSKEESEKLIIKDSNYNSIIKAHPKYLGIYTEGENIFSQINNIGIGIETKSKEHLYTYTEINNAKELLSNKEISKCGYDLKKQLNLLKYNNIDLEGKLLDIELMHYLINPEQSSKINILAKSLLNFDIEKTEEQTYSPTLFEDLNTEERGKNISKETVACDMIARKIQNSQDFKAVEKLYWEMEEPLLRVLAKMERNGVKIDLKQLNNFAEKLRKEIKTREERVKELAEEPGLNVGSPKQLGVILFEKLKLDPNAKKTSKGNWSTDETTLKSIAYTSPIIEEILAYREVKKLLSTYIEPFASYISPITGKVHTTFNQSLTSTGRLSSSNPNLQNIPIRTERGKEIRKAFIPSNKDGFILSADYSQIELRIMAHLSQDEHLIEAFNNGIDIHAATASKIFKIPHEEINAEQRRIAKTANFGIMYGISAYGLSQRLEISMSEAKKIINDYFNAFPSIKEFIGKTIDFAKENGYVETIFGRRRYIPEILSKNKTIQAVGERNAVNAPIQGTSADIIKLAMIKIDNRLEKEGLKSSMILQIHDELLFDVYNDEVEQLKSIVKEEMENIVSLSIPLTVECNYGKDWLEAH